MKSYHQYQGLSGVREFIRRRGVHYDNMDGIALEFFIPRWVGNCIWDDRKNLGGGGGVGEIERVRVKSYIFYIPA